MRAEGTPLQCGCYACNLPIAEYQSIWDEMGDHALAVPAATVVCTQGTKRIRPLFAEDEREEKKKKKKKEEEKV